MPEPVRGRVGEPADRAQHPVVVGQRLAHAHEHHVGQPTRLARNSPRGQRAPPATTCSTISAVDRLRVSPPCPVAQNGHAIPQPACDGHAHRDPVRVAHQHALDQGAVVQPPERLAGRPAVGSRRPAPRQQRAAAARRPARRGPRPAGRSSRPGRRSAGRSSAGRAGRRGTPAGPARRPRRAGRPGSRSARCRGGLPARAGRRRRAGGRVMAFPLSTTSGPPRAGPEVRTSASSDPGPGVGEDGAQDRLDLVELRLAADQRRRELDDGVAAVVGPAVQPGVEQRLGQEAAQQPLALRRR